MLEGIITVFLYFEVSNSADINEYLVNHSIKGVAVDAEYLVSAYQLKLAFYKSLLTEKQNLMKSKNSFQGEVAFHLSISGRVTEGVKQFSPSSSTSTVAVAIVTPSEDDIAPIASKLNEFIRYKSSSTDDNSFIVINEQKIQQLIEIYKLCPEEIGDVTDISMNTYKNIEDAIITKLAIKTL